MTHTWIKSRGLMCEICMGYSNILLYESEIIRSQLLIIIFIGILKNN